MRKRNKRIFSKNDPDDSDKVKDMLKAALVTLLTRKNITFEEFSRRHRDYHFSIGTPIDKIPSHRNNLVRALTKKGTLTYRMFQFILKNILHYNLTNFSMTLRDEDNNVELISIDRTTF